jgi:tetratricopeptide (TPR) repeat protein
MWVRLLAVLGVLLTVGCQGGAGVREPVWPYPTPPSAPSGESRERGAPPPQTGEVVPPPPIGSPRAIPSELPPAQRWPRSAAEVSGAAARSLLDQAENSRRAGQFEAAAASLERAVRIEPRNAFLWSALAANYIDIGNYDQAEAIAQRANSLANGNPHVEIANWNVIAAARSGRGDAQGSLQARARAEELESRVE